MRALKRALRALNTHLASKTYLVGHSVTLSDIIMACNLYLGFLCIMTKSFTAEFPHVERYYWTMVNLPNFRKVLGEVKQADAVPPVPSQKKPAEAEEPTQEPVRSKVEEEVAEKVGELEQGNKLYQWTKVDISDEGNRESVNAMIGEEDAFEGEALPDAKCFE